MDSLLSAPATAAQRQRDRMLGALIGLTGVISPSSAEKVLEQRFPRAAESNARALRLGLELAAGRAA